LASLFLEHSVYIYIYIYVNAATATATATATTATTRDGHETKKLETETLTSRDVIEMLKYKFY